MGNYKHIIQIIYHLIVLNGVFSKPTTELKTQAKVIIIGAGMSGITAAKTLHENGIDDFIILEGDDRIGGRMKNVEFGGNKVEVGANWVQGTEGNPIWELAKKYNLKGVVSNWEDYIVRNATGHDVTEEADERYEVLGKAEEAEYEMKMRRFNKGMPDMSVDVALALGGWRPKSAVDMAIEYYDYDFEYADPPSITSMQNTMKWSETDFKDEDFFVTDPRGFSHIVYSMKDEFMTKEDRRLQMKKTVLSIKQNDNSVTVKTCDGTEYTSEYVLLTVSIGVLENNKINFSPPLPEWKIERIYQFRMSNYIKIFVKFDDNVKPFWDNKEIIIHANNKRGYYTMWQNLQMPGMLPKGSNTLLVTVTGQEALRISGLPKHQVRGEVRDILFKLYGDRVPAKLDILVPDWVNNPLYHGCYSNWPVGVTSETHRALKANVGRIYFGGEATSSKYNGYVHGAYFSGIEQAEKLLKCMKSNICEEYVPIYLRKGCTYQNATNYNPVAADDDGSCTFKC